MQNHIRNSAFKAIIICALVAATGIKIFWNLGEAPLQRWDEQGNVHVVQTTLQSGNWLILKCKDKCSDCLPRDEAVPFLDKPPLWYWLTMLSVKMFGENNTAYRLVNAVAGFLLTMFIFRLGSTWFGFAAGAAATITILTTRHLFMTGDTFTTHSFRTADLDSLQLLLIMLAIFWLERALRRTGDAPQNLNFQTTPLALALLASCLAYFAKGPMGFLPIIIFILYLFVHAAGRLIDAAQARQRFVVTATAAARDTCRQASKTLFLLIIIMCAVLLPWYLYQYAHIGRLFIDEHVLYHLVRRAREPLEGHHGSWRFYFHIFFNLKIFLMGVPACLGILCLTTGACGRPQGTGFVPLTGLRWWQDFRFFSIVAGFVISFAVITIVQTKLMWYIFYVYPFAALSVGALTGSLVNCCRLPAHSRHTGI